jgi:hypothetical protein
MLLAEDLKERLLGLSAGDVMPATGMERHFVKVCRGEANPASPEERAWLRHVQSARMQDATDGQQAVEQGLRDEVERLRLLLARRVHDGDDEAARKITRYVAQLENLEAVLGQQQNFIKQLMDENAELRKRLEALNEGPLLVSHDDQARGFFICPACGGDGGAAGQCFKCDGSGWIRKWADMEDFDAS